MEVENILMKKAKYFLNATLIVSSLVLTLTYFLPVEASWAPFDAWKGYLEPSTGRFVQDIPTSLLEVFPYAVGVIVLLGFALRQWPTICISKIKVFLIGWASIAIYCVFQIAKDELYNYPKLWAIMGAMIIIPMILALFYVGLKLPKAKVSQIFLILLAACSLLQQMCEIAWYLLEDGLLLNIGSVTGITSATILFIGLIVRNLLEDKDNRGIKIETVSL